MSKQSLNGLWKIARDADNQGKALGWGATMPPECADAPVPGIVQEVFPFYDGVAWYYLRFTPQTQPVEGGRQLLRFQAVDYFAEVWLNGKPLGSHEDGEEPFAFDVTEQLRQGENLLAVRVIVPYEEPIDGFILEETPHRNKVNLNITPGQSQNVGGILDAVSLESVPAVYLTDVYVRPDFHTGEVRVEVEAMNASGAPAAVRLSAGVFEVIGGAQVLETSESAELAPGSGKLTLSFAMKDRRAWSFEDPFLYALTATLSVNSQTHARTARFGFREFLVKNGWFMLNGKRVWLKCAHTGNCYPITVSTIRNPDLMYRDLVFAKSMGFNAVRFISSLPLPLQLDYCDELGLMVYEEPFAAWLLADGPKMPERYARSVLNMARRDRNHPCVTIYGLLNETLKTAVYEQAKNFLPKLRAVDDTRLVLLSSGRFDGEACVGSLANPGSSEWEFLWGDEDPACNEVGAFGDVHDFPGPYMVRMGDVHVYPQVPQSARDTRFFRELGKNSKPIFVSEYGIGSQPNFIQEYRKFEQAGRPDVEEARMYRSMVEGLEADWKHYDLNDSFLFPEDFLVASIRENARQRQLTFDCMRANPMICGFNATGLLDHATCGEGFWTLWREFKPGLADTVREGFAPLRWAIFAERHVYAGAPVHVEAVLCNEDVLAPGRYPASLRIMGENGIVWEKECVAELPEKGCGGLPPLAVPVFDEWITLEEPGDYEIGVTLLEGGAPLGGRLKITASARMPRPTEGAFRAYAVGLDPHTEQWLGEQGVALMATWRAKFRAPILVGKDLGPEQWRTIYELVASGCNAIFLRPEAFAAGEDATSCLLLDNPGKCIYYRGWLYHLDNVYKRHPVFAGLGTGGFLSSEYYGPVYPKYMFEGIEKPDQTLCVALGGGQMRPSGYASGLTLGEFRFGEGKLVLNGFEIEQNLEAHPAADILLTNLLRHYDCKGALTPPTEALLARLEKLPK